MISTSNYPLVTMTTKAKDIRDYINKIQANLIREFGQRPIDAANTAEASLVNVVVWNGNTTLMSAIKVLEILDDIEQEELDIRRANCAPHH